MSRYSRATFYEEQRYGINYTDKPSLIRKNFFAPNRMVMDAKPLEPLLKVIKGESKKSLHNLNRSFDLAELKGTNSGVRKILTRRLTTMRLIVPTMRKYMLMIPK